MTDLDLLSIGCVVSFITLAGAYVFIRERFTVSDWSEERDERKKAEPAPVRAVESERPRGPRRAA